MRTRPALAATAALVSTLVASALATVTPGTASAADGSVSIYRVTQEGLVPEQAARLAEQAGIGNALRPDGSFSFSDAKRFAATPTASVPAEQRYGKEEDGKRTVAQAVNLKKLAKTTVISDADALALADKLLPPVDGFELKPSVDHTTVEVSDKAGKLVSRTPIDTTVSFHFSLDGRPVVGPGAKQRVAFAGDGSVIQLSQAARSVEPAGSVDIIGPDKALDACAALYGKGVGQGVPTLAYYAPPLTAERASGKGTIGLLLPAYVCTPKGVPKDGDVPLTGRMVPAARLTPEIKVSATGDGKTVQGGAEITGGTGPFQVSWSSSTTVLVGFGDGSVRYQRKAREKGDETLTATVTDANGIVSSASVTLPLGKGSASASGYGGLGGAFAEVGIEQTVDEWQCAQDSANGFRDVMQAHSQAVNFDWRGANAWEKDFRDSSLGGWDSVTVPKRYVDQVDAQWYTGHGSANSFTFKGAHDDGNITPSDARWGDGDLEWMQLESCQVLRDTNGSADYFSRWDEVFRGLHVLNGFHTNATCINGGTGRRFAEYLFPETFLWWTVRAPLSISQAWASMANDLEPAGTRWRSMSPMSGSIHNLNDRFWGQGTVGPDITSPTGFIAVSGVA